MADSVETNQQATETISVLVREGRTFPPLPEFTAQAIIKDTSVYDEAERDFEGFWLRRAKEFVEWFKEPTKSLEWDPPHCSWFEDGELNVAYNCLDRQVNAGRGDKVAYHWVTEPVDEEDQSITFARFKDEVCRFANGLRELGVRKGDRVGLYLGMVPQLPIAMLACARIGAPHVVVFGGFSPDSLGERMSSTGCKVLVTQDEAWRKGSAIPLKEIADKAIQQAPTIERMVVFRRTGNTVPMQESRDLW